MEKEYIYNKMMMAEKEKKGFNVAGSRHYIFFDIRLICIFIYCVCCYYYNLFILFSSTEVFNRERESTTGNRRKDSDT